MKIKKYVKPCQGFTLIEVLIALVIVSIALAATTVARTNSVASTNHLREKIFAHWVAENVLTEIRINKEFPSVTDQKSDIVTMGEIEWRWERKIEKTGSENLRRVTVSVYKEKSDNDSPPITFLNSLIINPNQLE